MDKTLYNILQFIYDYPNMEINKCDLTKRKRVKNVVPLHERYCALRRANEEQCTRRKKEGEIIVVLILKVDLMVKLSEKIW